MIQQRRRKFKFKYYGKVDDAKVLPDKKPVFYKTYLPDTASLEEKTLEKNIFSSLTRMDVFYTESLDIEQKISEFIDIYYTRVGESINTIIMLDEQIVSASVHKQISTNNNEATSSIKEIFFKDISKQESSKKPASKTYTSPTYETSLENTARKLYRTLVKSFHPDILAQKDDVDDMETDIIHSINDAYNQNHIGSLWRLRFEQKWKNAGNITTSERLKLLNYYNDKVNVAMQQIAEHRKQVTHSPEYDLYQKHLDAKLQGYDFIEQVEQDLHNEIIAKHRRIAYLKATGRFEEA